VVIKNISTESSGKLIGHQIRQSDLSYSWTM